MKYLILLLLSMLCVFAPAADVPHLSRPPCIDPLPRATAQPQLPRGVNRMAAHVQKFWPRDTVLRVKFLEGTTRQQNAAWKRFQIIDGLVGGITFVKVTTGNSDIRVAFRKDSGHWSALGTDARAYKQTEQTMNLELTKAAVGIFGDSDAEWDRVVLHEVCHSLGIVHEHSNPKGGIQWNVAKVRAYYHATQGWSDRQIYEQVLFKYSINQLRATEIDPKSIMMYPIPAELTLNGFAVGWNDKLTETDKKFLRDLYPTRAGAPVKKPTSHTSPVKAPARKIPQESRDLDNIDLEDTATLIRKLVEGR